MMTTMFLQTSKLASVYDIKIKDTIEWVKCHPAA